MFPELGGEPLSSAVMLVADGSGALMERHIQALKQVSNGHLTFDYKAGYIRGQFRYKEHFSSWAQQYFEVTYEKQPPELDGTKATKVSVKYWSYSLGKLDSWSMKANAARATLLSFMFPADLKQKLVQIKVFPG